jgi:F-type H+-transporting ATPase subunit delta
MSFQTTLRNKVKKLVNLSLDASKLIDLTQVKSVLKAIEGIPLSVHNKKLLLREYLKAMQRTEAQSQLVITFADAPNAAIINQIEQHWTQKAARSLRVVTHTDSNLIAGLKIRLGDNVWEDSVASRLSAFNQENL